MIKGPIRFLALLVLVLGVVFLVPTIAGAHSTTVVPGAYCSTPGEHGLSVQGVTYECRNQDKHLRWCPLPHPSASPSASATMSASPTPTKTVTVPPTTAPPTDAPPSLTTEPTTPGASTSPATALAVTGTKEDVMAGAGAALLLAGVGGVLYGRRKRTRFEA